MKKQNKKHDRRLKMLIFAVVVCTFILGVSTYAWFIGMRTVNVSSFEVGIATTESLSLSINGKDWVETLTINGENFNTGAYAGNTNSWGGEDGLIPMSSIGKINSDVSRLILYQKGSFTASDGGYRLMASQVNNTEANEGKGYVAFDLFIKNLSGDAYYDTVNILNEEAIYLTPDSKVTVSDAGVENTGIENSVRVAFAQIGRVSAETTEETTITGITCTDAGAVKGICKSRDATIWEPNDKAHVDNAINWYNTACKVREGADLTAEGAYTAGACGTVKNGAAYPTYAVAGVIDATSSVDNYDGAEYNTYTDTIAKAAEVEGAGKTAPNKLYGVDTFTDSEKNLKGTARPYFMYLAPNSITKVRVYIWIEGQDIDNYDFAQLGRQISVNFGFTKERFYGEDINYDGADETGLPEDVQNHMTAVAYAATGDVTTISDDYITYADGNFNVPKWITEFSFKDDDVTKLATKGEDPDGAWSFSEV